MSRKARWVVGKAIPFREAEPPAPGRVPGIYDATFGSFLQSGFDSVVLDLDHHNLHGVCTTMQKRLKQLRLDSQIVAIQREGPIYLVRRAAYEDGLGRR